MNKLFRIFFTHGLTTDLTPEEYAWLIEKLTVMKGGYIAFDAARPDGTKGRQILINIAHIAYIREFDIAPSAVVTPPTPQAIQRDKATQEAAKSADLGAVLETVKQEANPNVPQP